MEELRAYLKTLSVPEQMRFVERCGTSLGYLRKLLSVKRPPGAALCVQLERHSNGALTRQILRPNDWADIWPELRKAA